MAVSTTAQTLLEREHELDALRRALKASLAGDARLVFVGGEAGIGKTALVRAFAAESRSQVRILSGSCDPLATPRPLGPFADVAADTGGALAETATGGARAHDIASALVAELRHRPTLLVLEDLHWGDEATLDVLRLLGRRADTTRALVVVTYRDDELGPAHPLRLVLGSLATAPGCERLSLEPLSLSAVRVLSVLHGVDPDALYRRTGGNPFFVTEALASGEEAVPSTVRDAVLTRAARLEVHGRAALEACAIVPGTAELAFLESMDASDGLDECLASGMLVERTPRTIGFRHELARLAVEESIPPQRRMLLHRRAFSTLTHSRSLGADSVRLAFHAEEAGEGGAVLEHAPAAARRAAASGAHREAAAQYARALRFATGLEPREQAALLVKRAHECYLTGENNEAMAARREALRRYREVGDVRAQGDQLCWISRLEWYRGHREESDAAAFEAVALLEPLGPTPELARACVAVASRRQIEMDLDGTRRWGERALALATALDETEIAVRAQVTVGSIGAFSGEGEEPLRSALARARDHELDDLVELAQGNLAVALVRQRRWCGAHEEIEKGLAYANDHDLEGSRTYLLTWRASAAVALGHFDDATSDLTDVLANPYTSVPVRASALLTFGLLRARRGDPDVWPALDEFLVLGQRAAGPPKLAPGAVARAEAAFLGGDVPRAAKEVAGIDPATLADRWVAGEVAVWRRRGDAGTDDPGELPEPFALELAGRTADAADAWSGLDSPYEAALTRAMGDEEHDVRRAHDELLALGALGAARFVARRLRERGVRRIARGPRPATRENVAGLTPRELEVLGHVADGVRNADIAARMHVSRRTVDHHVSAVLRKLDVRTRGEATRVATVLGLLEDR
jgi:DNA-binding CsgD family transcriptional regulator